MLGIDQDKIPQQLRYIKGALLPYPDLEGNMIKGIDTVNRKSGTDNADNEMSSGNNDNVTDPGSDTGSNSGQMGTVLD